MSRAKKGNTGSIPPFLSRGTYTSGGKPHRDTFAPVYMSILLSPAYQDLTLRQRNLLICMYEELYAQHNKPCATWEKQGHDPESNPYSHTDIYFPCERAAEYYSGYSKRKAFSDDRGELERHGFIQTVSKGKKTRTLSVYRFSSAWKTWNNEPP